MYPIGSNNVTDMFPPGPWTLASTTAYCQSLFNATPRPAWIPMKMGMNDIQKFARTNSYILFAYGLLDPWYSLGVGLNNLSR